MCYFIIMIVIDVVTSIPFTIIINSIVDIVIISIIYHTFHGLAITRLLHVNIIKGTQYNKLLSRRNTPRTQAQWRT